VLCNLSYGEKLACLELNTLECRRLKADLILYYKIMHNLTPWPIERYFNMSLHSRHTRLAESISDFHISAPFCRTVAYQSIYSGCVLPNKRRRRVSSSKHSSRMTLSHYHDDGIRGRRLFVCLSVCLSVCFSARSATIDAARITKLDIAMFHHESWNPSLSGSKGQKSRSRCTNNSAGVGFALL